MDMQLDLSVMDMIVHQDGIIGLLPTLGPLHGARMVSLKSNVRNFCKII